MRNVVKITTLFSWLDLLIPHYCQMCGALGGIICERCKNYNTLRIERLDPDDSAELANDLNLQKFFAVGFYSGPLANLIVLYKFHACRDLARPLAELLAGVLQQKQKLPDNAIVVPIPTVAKHIRQRGFDHARRLAVEFAKATNRGHQQLLRRKTSTVQVGSRQEERINQAAEAFELSPHVKIEQNATYILLDDVCTTGATLSFAARALRSGGAKTIWVACLARH